VLEAKNIRKTYDDGKKELPVLKGVNFKIERSCFSAVVGPSGAGKSTLLHILGGLDSPTGGEVFLEGQDIYALQDAALAAIRNTRIGFVFQFYHLLSEFTVLENVMMPGLISEKRKAKSEKLKTEALSLFEKVGLRDRVAHFPAQLSGGEKQRVAIARSLINRPDILLCDEPTGNLDSRAGEEVIALIRDISRQNQMAVALVTHNLELAKAADKVYHLEDGQLT
jgi:lipoprotein-releasing system ATP-binding protein